MRFFVLLFIFVLSSNLLEAFAVTEKIDSAKYMGFSNPVLYTVQVRSVIVPPARKPVAPQLRVWHALPTPYKAKHRIITAGDVKFAPAKYVRRELEKDQISSHILFDQKDDMVQGKPLNFATQFSILSSDRELVRRYENKVTWGKIRAMGYSHESELPHEVIKIVDQYKHQYNPTNALRKVCLWIKSNIKYDQTASWNIEDVAKTVRARKGHCGHMAALFEHMCDRMKIKYRRVWGICLTDPKSKTYENLHTWGRVLLPELGWIEIDPYGGERCFYIPSRMIECNSAFQAFSAWITTKERKPIMLPLSQDSGGGIRYSVSHKITFVKKPVSKSYWDNKRGR